MDNLNALMPWLAMGADQNQSSNGDDILYYNPNGYIPKPRPGQRLVPRPAPAPAFAPAPAPSAPPAQASPDPELDQVRLALHQRLAGRSPASESPGAAPEMSGPTPPEEEFGPTPPQAVSPQAPQATTPEEANPDLLSSAMGLSHDELARKFVNMAKDYREHLNKSTTNNVQMTPTLPTETDLEKLNSLANNYEIGAFQKQDDGANKIQGMYDQLAQKPQQPNLSPLMALWDSWYGTKLLPGYKDMAPESPDKHGIDMIKLQDEINKERSGLSKTTIDYMRMLLGGKSTQTVNQIDQSKVGGSTENTSTIGTPNAMGKGLAPTQNYAKWMGELHRDKALTDSQDAINHLNQVYSMLQANTPISATEYRFPLIRALGASARMNQAEFSAQKGGQSMADRFNQTGQTLLDGKLSEDNRQGFMDLVKGMLGQYQAIQERHMQQARVTGRNYGVTPDRVESTLGETFKAQPISTDSGGDLKSMFQDWKKSKGGQ